MYLYEIMRFIKVNDVAPKCRFKNGLSTNKKNPAKFPNIICGSEEVWNYNYIKYVCHDHDNGRALYLNLGGCFLIELIRVIYNRYNLYFMKLILFTKQFDNFSMKGQISAVYFANIRNHYERSSTRTYILNHKLNTIISPTMNNGLITPVRADVPNGYTPRYTAYKYRQILNILVQWFKNTTFDLIKSNISPRQLFDLDLGTAGDDNLLRAGNLNASFDVRGSYQFVIYYTS
jgi:hypothetical protein